MAGITVSAIGVKSGPLTKPATIDLVGETVDGTISGTTGATTIPSGEVWKITGNTTLTGALVVEGTLLGVDTFTLNGGGFQIVAQEGGRINLAGVAKTGWVRWGDTVSGWQTGDRLMVAPTATNDWEPKETTWEGSWGATNRPSGTADFTLPDSTVMKPEVANLTRSIVLQNLQRLHFHDTAAFQTLKYLTILNAGETSVLDMYPMHFHILGEAARGSVVEGVVVEGGKNHAYVPHGSHGITFYDCVAYNTTSDAFWWNRSNPAMPDASKDILWDHCLAMKVLPDPAEGGGHPRVSGFALMAGPDSSNILKNSAAVGVLGGKNSAGVNWPDAAKTIWIFEDFVSHNNKNNGLFVWQNTNGQHFIDRFISYQNGKSGIEHGAYDNRYQYRGSVIDVPTGAVAIILHVKSKGPENPLLFEDRLTNGRLLVAGHQLAPTHFTVFRNCTFTGVTYEEGTNQPSLIRFDDCGLVPADFTFTSIRPGSQIEIYEGGVLQDRWISGAWE